ncbi:hypothetical protein HMPREF1050_1434 [Haemophilus parahaemolyticus HK385]|uniref:Uncharacterized protein n=1 Tax=Haemophilus parahaemolyticus HK385 TaxID=1095744 RepID=A0ABN0F1E7_HAEPH|nr:hypothetical protein HMPREF1050_1434 [Haemophilus parahaemolyticus HK385]
MLHGRAQLVFTRCGWIKAFEILRNLLLGEQPEPSNQRLHICNADYL